MNWKRGLVLAGLNLLAAVPMILLLDVRDARELRNRDQNDARTDLHLQLKPAFRPSSVRILRVQEEQAVGFNPCGMSPNYSTLQEIVYIGNIPASTITGWRAFCRPEWSISGRLFGP